MSCGQYKEVGPTIMDQKFAFCLTIVLLCEYVIVWIYLSLYSILDGIVLFSALLSSVFLAFTRLYGMLSVILQLKMLPIAYLGGYFSVAYWYTALSSIDNFLYVRCFQEVIIEEHIFPKCNIFSYIVHLFRTMLLWV